ncbi:N-6 DNA methylase [Candidatus Nitrotoga sp. M5]|uniref:N-6 DNA methylase n=1 Tax=Candidatus Nitrotoga sp. M5 TaxID=2890409 RepID=UPI001EF35CA6|nr:N-6 DNA methylase [Candidatus Nitrotoga sp. M5]CAH1386545.1 Type I restriction-modification system, specificity subunit S [Candidatus Nitrotoga sp. M5]
MLDTDTKRRIDTARDILVGKVPDPKSQVEQITIALIYKFMDDMDREAEDLGGKRKFFTGEFARFGWEKLMSKGLGGHELIALYGEGIDTMPENPGIPPLFRDIFKNAYLPYRDPETLKSFLKIINEFSYDHSERLGDAFEYLLSVLGSQGDAGQFRTPRHIIDFIVEILAPQKGETILDPACGTAGFLISAYKHILRSNTDAKNRSTLTPDEKGQLAQNFKGYDISPDMVRLSLVNLYLHGFTDPHIVEYDTLTSEERWNEYADVILANPPFMSPKGGIKPHKRFSIQAKRSEVLFVDYMAEHLTPFGRAGIIVPEGIIFQSQTAYKALRKMLVENSLVAVISLPAGCFNPYSGVKTSILILDKSIARQSDSVAFFKVENDGYGLGAQRRANAGEQLTQVQAELAEYLQTLRSDACRANGPSLSQPGATPQEYGAINTKGLKACSISRNEDRAGLRPLDVAGIREPGATPQAGMDCTVGAKFRLGLIVAKGKIAANGDYNLSGERYREGAINKTHDWPMVELGKFARLINGRAYKQEELLTEGPTPVLRVGNFFSNRGWYYSNLELDEDKYCNTGDLLYAWSASFGPRIWEGPRAIYHYHIWKVEPTEAIDKLFLYHLLEADSAKIKAEGNGIAMVHATKGGMEQRKFPLPPLDVQKEIVAEIEGLQKVIDGARAVLDNYRPHIPIHPDWPMVELDEICEIKSGGTPSRPVDAYWNGNIPWVGSTVCKDGEVTKAEEFITEEGLKNSAAKLFPKDTTLIALVGATIGKTGLLKFESTTNQNIAGLYPKSREVLDPLYLFHAAQRLYPEFMRLGEGKFRMANISFVREQKIPLPSLATQQAIVAEIEAEQALVAANRKLIACFEKKIQATLARIWGEDEETAEPVILQ